MRLVYNNAIIIKGDAKQILCDCGQYLLHFVCAIGNRSLYTLGDGTQKLNFR